MIVVAGATGFVGRNLVRALMEAGRPVRGGTRDVAKARRAEPGREWVHLDVEDPASLDAALQGADALVYLVHQMRAGHDGLGAREAASALQVRQAAERAGVRRIVYLGGPSPTSSVSEHLAARLQTGEVLRAGAVSTIELRAAMIIGPGSESWMMVRDLALRLPVMILPRWLRYRTQPIGLDDVVAALIRAVDLPISGSRWFDLPGPEALSGRDVLERVAAQVGIRPVMIPVPVLSPRLSSHWLRLVTRADYGIARQLVDGCVTDLLAADDGFWAEAPDLQRTPFDEVVRRALAAEDAVGPAGLRWERLVARLARKVRS